MSNAPDGMTRGRMIATGTSLAVIVGSLIAIGIGVHRVAGSNSASGVPTPPPTATPRPTPTASPTPALIAFADCSTVKFGDPLPPKDAPADVHKYAAAPQMQIDTSKLYQATITTAKGNIVLCLQPELAPLTVNNFVVLARNHFYDKLTFHRVEAGFVIQGGDPKGDGTGGPGYSFSDEPVHNAYVDGAVAMANSGPNSNGSQFFVCIGAQCASLPHSYNLFGKVETGLDVALKIAKGDVITSITVREEQ